MSRAPRPDELDPIERASRDEIEALQLARLKDTLQRCYANVPHYRQAFDAKGVHPSDCTVRDTYADKGLVDMWEEQAGFGYSTGIAMALHLPEGRHFMLGVDRDQPLPGDPLELQRTVADLQLFAVMAQDVAMRIFEACMALPAFERAHPRNCPDANA